MSVIIITMLPIKETIPVLVNQFLYFGADFKSAIQALKDMRNKPFIVFSADEKIDVDIGEAYYLAEYNGNKYTLHAKYYDEHTFIKQY